MIIVDKYDVTYHEHLCDECGSGDQLYEIEEKELCEECIIKYFGEAYMEEIKFG